MLTIAATHQLSGNTCPNTPKLPAPRASEGSER